MKLKKINKLLALSIVTAVVINPFGSIANAMSSNEVGNQYESIEKANFKILSDDLDNIIYTYDEQGTSYRVEEKVANDFSSVKSTIYEKNNKNEYVISSKLETTISDNEVTLKTQEDNNITTEVVPLSDLITVNGEPTYDDSMAKNRDTWTYNQTLKTSSKFLTYTLGAITAVITTAVSFKLGEGGKLLAAAISSVAQKVISDNIKQVYYKKDFYYTYYQNTILPRGEKVISKAYKNSGRTQQIGKTMTDYYYR
ncbi:hypothetical protein [Clostridioides sp. ZZV14-6345]|uniref:hypothetical protein n=1 Tax=Clostridioides sp. ZZV14-6345 TaxID=2811496 RepID=UPI001D1140AD|nr:hypothetical protein [Clostridioides sp. ZZV14-6345]